MAGKYYPNIRNICSRGINRLALVDNLTVSVIGSEKPGHFIPVTGEYFISLVEN
jgi:hypothetical protein